MLFGATEQLYRKLQQKLSRDMKTDSENQIKYGNLSRKCIQNRREYFDTGQIVVNLDFI